MRFYDTFVSILELLYPEPFCVTIVAVRGAFEYSRTQAFVQANSESAVENLIIPRTEKLNPSTAKPLEIITRMHMMWGA